MLELPNYSSQLMQQLWALRHGEHFCDCTVFVGDTPHRAHKLLLAASSMLFRSLLGTSDTISIDTAVVSSEEFSCLLDMVYTGKLPLGKHNVSRIIAAADTLQMFDVAIGFKKILSTIMNPKTSHPEDTAQVLPQDEMKKDSTETSATPGQESPLIQNESIQDTKSASDPSPPVKRKKENNEQTSDSDCTDKPAHKTVASEPHGALEDAEKEEGSHEQPSATVLQVLDHSSVIIKLLNKLPAIRDLLRKAAEHSLDEQNRQVVITCCDKVDPDKVGEMLLSHVKKGVLSETAFITLLRVVHENDPTTTSELQSVLQELEPDTAGPNQLKDSTQRGRETEDTKDVEEEEEKDSKEKDREEEESITDDSDNYVSKKEPQPPLPKKHTCRSCKRSFSYKCRLRVHMKRCSAQRPLHQCLKCHETFLTNRALTLHQIDKHNIKDKKKAECELCGRTFAQPSGMIYHMRSEHFYEKPFTCTECGAKFAAKSSLKNHERLHTGEKPFTCKECGMSFSVAAGLAYHIKKKHSQGNMYTCQYCKAEFAQSIELTRHVRTHTGDRPYVCRVCGKGYSQASQLTTHLESTHATSEAFDCQKCSLSFSSQIEHNQHIQKVHPDELFKCPACEKVFSNVSLLNRHKSTHTGLKLFSCELCNKSYQQLSGLWYHNRTQHAEVFSNHTREFKPMVQCDICVKFFPNEQTLAQHQAIEHQGTSGSSFRCPFCPALFAGEDSMKEHFTTHHAEHKETMCMHCFVVYGSALELQDHMHTQHPAESQEEQEAITMKDPAEAPEETADDAEQIGDAECLVQAEPSHTADLALSETQTHIENAQQVLVALADGQEGAQVVEMSMFDLLNNSVTFICEKSAPGTSAQP